jgi:hypothetical protein
MTIKKKKEEGSVKNVVITIVSIIAFFLVMGLVRLVGEEAGKQITGSSTSDVTRALQQQASDLNEGYPAMIDSETRIDGVTGYGRTFSYRYTMINYQLEELNPDYFQELRPEIRSQICSDPVFEWQRDNSIIMSYTYYDMDGDFISSFEIDAGECR